MMRRLMSSLLGLFSVSSSLEYLRTLITYPVLRTLAWMCLLSGA